MGYGAHLSAPIFLQVAETIRWNDQLAEVEAAAVGAPGAAELLTLASDYDSLGERMVGSDDQRARAKRVRREYVPGSSLAGTSVEKAQPATRSAQDSVQSTRAWILFPAHIDGFCPRERLRDAVHRSPRQRRVWQDMVEERVRAGFVTECKGNGHVAVINNRRAVESADLGRRVEQIGGERNENRIPCSLDRTVFTVHVVSDILPRRSSF